MMEALKGWLTVVITVSLVWAAADSLIPAGGVKQVGKLACTLCVLCVTLMPLTALRGEGMTWWIREISAELAPARSELEERAAQTQKEVIEGACAAYISDKVAELGLTCRVEMDCVQNTDGLWLPASVRLWGDFTDVTRSSLMELLERELGIEREAQTYYQTKEEMP